jgi:type III secretory pathway component EscV
MESEEKGRETEDEKIDLGFAVVILVASPFIILPLFTGKTELLIGVSMSTAVNILAIAKCWDLKKYLWFWIVVLLILAIHMSLAFFAHWPRVTMTRLTLLPIGAIYYCLTLGVVRFLEKFIVKYRVRNEE